MSTDFSATRRLFDLPEGILYLDGNSLGPLPRSVLARMAQTVGEEWRAQLIRAWNTSGWADQPRRLGDRIGRLVGAPAGSVVLGDTLSVKIYQALAAALDLVPDRRVVLSDRGNFPTDLYMAEGLLRTLGDGYRLRLVDPEDVADAIDGTVAAVMLTEVDYRSGRRHDMADLTRRAHAAGAVTVWDLAHSAGALPVDLAGCDVDFAAGCTYKYLNGGPGAPAFIYVAPRHAGQALPALSGWFGHSAPFDFELSYRPAADISRMRIGTPPVLQMAALEAALDVWDMVDMQDLRRRSLELADRFIGRCRAALPDLELVTPLDPARRGSQVSFRHPEGYAVMQALIARGVIGDFRAPDILRFGITPLYLAEAEIDLAADILAEILHGRLWDRDEYRIRAAVT